MPGSCWLWPPPVQLKLLHLFLGLETYTLAPVHIPVLLLQRWFSQAHLWNPSLCSLLCPSQTLADSARLVRWESAGRNVVRAKRLALTSSQGGFSCKGCFSMALWTVVELTTAPPGMSLSDPVVAAAGRGSALSLGCCTRRASLIEKRGVCLHGSKGESWKMTFRWISQVICPSLVLSTSSVMWV